MLLMSGAAHCTPLRNTKRSLVPGGTRAHTPPLLCTPEYPPPADEGDAGLLGARLLAPLPLLLLLPLPLVLLLLRLLMVVQN